MGKIKGEIKHFLNRVGWAAEGIKTAFRKERNLQIQGTVGLCVMVFAPLIHVSLTHYLILLILTAGVLSLELLNTAIERVVDLVTPQYHPLAKQAKDISAGAVLLFSIFSVMIGLVIIYQTIMS